MTDTDIIATGLFRYPIKSCAGAALDQATFNARGITHDREFLVIESESGRFLTQREVPRMALVRPEVMLGGLTLWGPEGAGHHLHETITSGPERTVTIWKDTCPAVDQGDTVAEWLSDVLGRSCRLVRMVEGYVRQVDQTYAVSAADQVGFADGYPALLISEESLDGLNARLTNAGEPALPMNRFRPNIVVQGAGEPHAEDTWTRITIGECDFHVVKACARCAITTTDQETTERGKEPLRTLATYRKTERGVTFGQNVIHTAPGTISVGDVVRNQT